MPLRRPALGSECRGGQVIAARLVTRPASAKTSPQPDLEAQWHRIGVVLDSVGDLTGEMSEARLVTEAVALLSGVPIRGGVFGSCVNSGVCQNVDILKAGPAPKWVFGSVFLLRRAQARFQSGRETALSSLRGAKIVASDENDVRIEGSNTSHWVFAFAQAPRAEEGYERLPRTVGRRGRNRHPNRHRHKLPQRHQHLRHNPQSSRRPIPLVRGVGNLVSHSLVPSRQRIRVRRRNEPQTDPERSGATLDGKQSGCFELICLKKIQKAFHIRAIIIPKFLNLLSII